VPVPFRETGLLSFKNLPFLIFSKFPGQLSLTNDSFFHYIYSTHTKMGPCLFSTKDQKENPPLWVNHNTSKGGYCENSCMYQTGS